MGCIYKRGNIYWLKYYRNGKPYQESSRSKVKQVAKALLKRREGEIGAGKVPGIVFDKVIFDELAEDFLRDYRINQRKSLIRAERSVKQLKAFFEGYKVPNIGTPMINQYIEKRLESGAANATINRELSALKRMLNIGAKQTPTKVDRVPYIQLLKENNTRQGFFEHVEFFALRDELPDYLKGFVTFAYKTGWRLGEIQNLKWSQVDRRRGIVRLEAGMTKNDDARTVYLDDELKGVFDRQWELRKQNGALTPYVFPREDGKGAIGQFRKTWASACKKVGIGKMLFHDFRRSAVRNMVRAGIPERVVMMVSGHRTRSVFERYNIVNDADLKMAAKRHAAYLDTQKGYSLATVRRFDEKEVNRCNG
jgi:integrase